MKDKYFFDVSIYMREYNNKVKAAYSNEQLYMIYINKILQYCYIYTNNKDHFPNIYISGYDMDKLIRYHEFNTNISKNNLKGYKVYTHDYLKEYQFYLSDNHKNLEKIFRKDKINKLLHINEKE